MTEALRLPEGMTADKLRFIAEYVTECDDIIGRLLRLAKADGLMIDEETLEMVTSKAVQEDLRRWADEIEGAS